MRKGQSQGWSRDLPKEDDPRVLVVGDLPPIVYGETVSDILPIAGKDGEDDGE